MKHLRKEITAEYFNSLGKEYLPGLLNVEIVSLDEGKLNGSMEIKHFHMAPNGYLHAASIVALADTCCGYATVAHLPEGAQGFTTIELKSNHLGTQRDGKIHCVATAQHMGRTTQVWDAVVTSEESGNKIAMFRCTQMVLWPKE
ncbi:MAG: PaaI family thioesterase [Desulfitobacterium sp.]